MKQRDLIDRGRLLRDPYFIEDRYPESHLLRMAINEQPTVNAVILPKGKPGDYLEWNNGTGFRKIYYIRAIIICPDMIRYDLGEFAPGVNSCNIVRIMNREEAEKALEEMKYG